jgi:hypothetical protein
VDFVVFKRESAWFWLLINPLGSGGVIGAAINEARAIREACLSIEALLTVSLM